MSNIKKISQKNLIINDRHLMVGVNGENMNGKKRLETINRNEEKQGWYVFKENNNNNVSTFRTFHCHKICQVNNVNI